MLVCTGFTLFSVKNNSHSNKNPTILCMFDLSQFRRQCLKWFSFLENLCSKTSNLFGTSNTFIDQYLMFFFQWILEQNFLLSYSVKRLNSRILEMLQFVVSCIDNIRPYFCREESLKFFNIFNGRRRNLRLHLALKDIFYLSIHLIFPCHF